MLQRGVAITPGIAFGDYKPPGYIYAAAPLVKILGLNEFSVRVPSMIAGILMVLVTYLLVQELFRKKRTVPTLDPWPWARSWGRSAVKVPLVKI